MGRAPCALRVPRASFGVRVPSLASAVASRTHTRLPMSCTYPLPSLITINHSCNLPAPGPRSPQRRQTAYSCTRHIHTAAQMAAHGPLRMPTLPAHSAASQLLCSVPVAAHMASQFLGLAYHPSRSKVFSAFITKGLCRYGEEETHPIHFFLPFLLFLPCLPAGSGASSEDG